MQGKALSGVPVYCREEPHMQEKRIGAIGLLGGDARQAYLARALQEEGWQTAVSQMERASGLQGLCQLSPSDMCAQCDVILLPLPATRDGRTLFAPWAESPLPLDDQLGELLAGHRVLGGMTGKLPRTGAWAQIECADYYRREEVLTGNGVLTAEGAIGAAVTGHPGSLFGARCLVTGFGRIAKPLCLGLRGLGARVDCAARRAEDLLSIRALGCTPRAFGELERPYDLIFNTVPSPVLGEAFLKRQGEDALLLELASAPGGFDLEAAGRLGLRVQAEPGLPGRIAPKAAGELIKGAVCAMLAEAR